VSAVAVVILMLNEAAALPRLLRCLRMLHPAPFEIIAVDGGSTDDSVAIAAAGGLRVITAPRGRGAGINAGVAAATAALVCVLHADTILPDDAVAVIGATMADRRLALASFLPLLSGPGGVRWGTSLHNWAKTYYGPMLFRPLMFLRGARLLFGDHAMFFRRDDFLAAGGCDTTLPIMEDADLCVRLHRFGRTRMVNRVVITSDRRIAAWGPVRANLIYLRVSISWAIGLRRELHRHYPDIR
jgi:glycosyltransferase involved in cell wall biosynthesis